jgi:hypothetical protein
MRWYMGLHPRTVRSVLFHFCLTCERNYNDASRTAPFGAVPAACCLVHPFITVSVALAHGHTTVGDYTVVIG